MRDYTAPISDESPVEVAIIDANTLARIGLQRIIEEVMPTVVVRGFGSLEELIDDTPYAYAYCFVSASIYLSRINYFRNHHLRAIVLVGDDTNPTLQGIPTLNTMQGEQALARSLMALQGYGEPASTPQAPSRPTHAARTLGTRGRGAGAHCPRTDEQADCRPPTHKPHHRHLAPQEHHREAGNKVRTRTHHLRRPQWLRRCRRHLRRPRQTITSLQSNSIFPSARRNVRKSCTKIL